MLLYCSALLGMALPFTGLAKEAKPACIKGVWNAACFEESPEGRRLKPQYLKRVRFERNGFAVLYLEPREYVAINRRGDVVIPGIVTGDFHYTEAENGVVAYYASSKRKGQQSIARCGYFQLKDFKILVPPIYSICGPFHRQQAYVCIGCAFDCGDCHNYEYYGGQGFIINKRNKILKKVTLPQIPKCSTVEEQGGFPESQPCRASSK